MDETRETVAAEKELLVGTDTWKCMPIDAYSPSTKTCWVEVHDVASTEEDRKEALRWWPIDIKPWSACVWLRDAEIQIAEPEVWKL